MGVRDTSQGTTNDTFQVGKRGPKLKISSTTRMSVRDEPDAALANMEGADPAADQDFVTRAYGDANYGFSWVWVCGRASNNVTNLWLRTTDRLPLNQSPWRVPFDAELLYITATTDGNETCDFEVYRNTDVRNGGNPSDANKIAELQFSGQESGTGDLTGAPVQVDAGDEIGVFMRGNTIDRPHVSLFFRRRT